MGDGSGGQWLPQLTCIDTDKTLQMTMGCWPVNHEESPGIQSQSPQHARTDRRVNFTLILKGIAHRMSTFISEIICLLTTLVTVCLQLY